MIDIREKKFLDILIILGKKNKRERFDDKFLENNNKQIGQVWKLKFYKYMYLISN